MIFRTVRVKWYPSAKAVRKWPDGLGEIWLDMPLERDGSLNLRPVMRRWGMENCYVRIPNLVNDSLACADAIPPRFSMATVTSLTKNDVLRLMLPPLLSTCCLETSTKLSVSPVRYSS